MNMLAWTVDTPGPIAGGPLTILRRARPEPAGREIQVRVEVCAVCRTDLHLAEGDLRPRRRGVVPGHEIVGTVSAAGADARRFRVGDRVGIAWLRHTCGACVFCRRGQENLCPASQYTGWDADGGFAEFTVVDEEFAYALPEGYEAAELAPLLCAGIIGYRALRRADLPPRGVLGVYGFGASAHLTMQVALAQGSRVHVLTRSEKARALALELGASSAGPADGRPPEELDGAILFAPAGELVLPALEALRAGATLAVAGIHLSDIPSLDYARHLFRERSLRSVTANTREDGRELLAFAGRHRLNVVTTPYGFHRVDRALRDLAADRVEGAAVIRLPAG